MKAVEQNHPTANNGSQGNGRRARFQRLVLALLLIVPFGLYLALDAGNDLLAIFFFSLITICMALMVWKG